MKFLRLTQIELSRPNNDPWHYQSEINGVTLQIQRRGEEDTSRLRLLVWAEVPLESRPQLDTDGKINVEEGIVRRSEQAIELFADLAAVATCSTRTIKSMVPAAGFSDVSLADRQWLDTCSGLSQSTQRIALIPAIISITDPGLRALGDRRSGVALLAEALANTHETGRFREIARFFEEAFAEKPGNLVTPLSDFLGYYDRLQYTHDEIKTWHQLRNRATHADQPNNPKKQPALARDVRPVLMRVELAAYDVLFNKLNWNKPDSARRDVWTPTGGVLRDERHAILRTQTATRMEAIVMLDGFGAYPQDPSAKLESSREDWWLGTAIAGQTKIETVESLKTQST
ncbi:MAG: hypothetical protein M3Y48_21565 [Actinomycetota bacterium]|nr:hypothetical protein [Actinomycetota bacterium]